MASVLEATIAGFNDYLTNTLKALPGQTNYSLVLFDSSGVEQRYLDQDVAAAAPLTTATYLPGAMTPLYEAVSRAIDALRASLEGSGRAGEPVLFVIQTDGQENASAPEYRDVAALKAKIQERQDAGWEFVYLGCGLNAYGDASALGVGSGQTMSYGQGNTAQAFTASSASTRRWAASGGARGMAAYTTDEKMTAGDVYDPDRATAAPVAPRPQRPTTTPLTGISFTRRS